MVAALQSLTGSASTQFRAQSAAGCIVRPRCIFAARRHFFDVEIRKMVSAPAAIDLLFACLPLAACGWDRDSATIEFVGGSMHWPIWRLSRG